jgi:hypothetical protein
MTNEKYCARCQGAGQVDTGIMESPVTICNDCNGTGLAPQPKPEHNEPVAWMKEGWGSDCGPYVEFYRDDEMGWRDQKEWTPLYTTPQQRKPLELSQMVRLTYDIDEDKPATQQELYNLIRKVEAAHGIKGDA